MAKHREKSDAEYLAEATRELEAFLGTGTPAPDRSPRLVPADWIFLHSTLQWLAVDGRRFNAEAPFADIQAEVGAARRRHEGRTT